MEYDIFMVKEAKGPHPGHLYYVVIISVQQPTVCMFVRYTEEWGATQYYADITTGILYTPNEIEIEKEVFLDYPIRLRSTE